MKHKKKWLASAAVVILLIVVALVAMRAMQSVSDTAAPLTQQKNTQLNTLQDAAQDALPPDVDKYNPQVRDSRLRDSGRKGVGLFIRHAFFRIAGDIGFDVDTLSALLVPTDKRRPVTLDDPHSFIFKPLHGSVVMPASALTGLFNQYLTDYPGAQLRRLSVTTRDNGMLHVEGQTQKVPGLWLPFKMTGPVRLVAGHLFVYQPDKIDIARIKAKGLLDAINLQLSKLVQIDTEGAQLTGDNIVLDLNHSLPPPTQDVHVASMHVDAAGMHLDFTSPFHPDWPQPILDTSSYILMDGGDIKTFRALITNVRMQLIAAKGGKLDTSLYNYRQQIVGGHFGSTTAGGLVAYMAPLEPASYIPPAQPEKDDDQ